MKTGLASYLGAAFSARPWGMLLPPNWIAVGAFALLGFLNPGFWLFGLGLELAYLLVLSHHPRFRAVVDGRILHDHHHAGEQEIQTRLKTLTPERRERFQALRKKCGQILERQAAEARGIQGGGLSRLLGLHLRLLLTQAAMEKMLGEEDADSAEIGEKVSELRARLTRGGLDADLERSLSGQVEILEKRREALTEGESRLRFAESELERIEHQVALVRDEIELSSTPETVGLQIDRISGELSETSRWIGEQSRFLSGEDFSDSSLTINVEPSATQ